MSGPCKHSCGLSGQAMETWNRSVSVPTAFMRNRPSDANTSSDMLRVPYAAMSTFL